MMVVVKENIKQYIYQELGWLLALFKIFLGDAGSRLWVVSGLLQFINMLGSCKWRC